MFPAHPEREGHILCPFFIFSGWRLPGRRRDALGSNCTRHHFVRNTRVPLRPTDVVIRRV